MCKLVIDCREGAKEAIEVIIVPTITLPLQNPTYYEEVCNLVPGLDFADPPESLSDASVDILIGLDYYWMFVTADFKAVVPGVAAIATKVGWLLSGCVPSDEDGVRSVATCFCAAKPLDSSECLERFWNLESVGIKDDYNICPKEDAQTVQHFKETVQVVNNRYEVAFHWKSDCSTLPDNYSVARRRLTYLVNRLRRHGLANRYNKVIHDQLTRNFIEEVSDPSAIKGIVHYLPHHPVIKDSHATTKMHIVYNASAKLSAHAPSLNDCPSKGPNYISDLCSILLRFRAHKIAVVSDIEKAFLQIGIQEQDRDATRFIWIRDVNQNDTPENVIVYRFKRVCFGLISSPFHLAATIRHHLDKDGSATALDMRDNFYVDNLLLGRDDVPSALQLYGNAKRLMAAAKMNIGEWNSNAKDFMDRVPVDDRTADTDVKILGLKWKTASDVLCINTEFPSLNLDRSSGLTKRNILQLNRQMLQPNGVFAPVVISTKIFMQELWNANIGWDDAIYNALHSKFLLLYKEMQQIQAIEVPRYVTFQQQANVDLHVFADASPKAYAAVAYLHSTKLERAGLVFSKTRVAPIKTLTIPRLDLLGVLMAARISTFIRQNVAVKKVIIYSDSQIVLAWLANTKQLPQFVRNRIEQVKRHCDNFIYCPTNDNPADLGTRGCTASSLKDNSLWWVVPAWLNGINLGAALDDAPCDTRYVENSETTDPSSAVPGDVTLLSAARPSAALSPPFGMNLERFGSLRKLFNTTSYVSRFIYNLQHRDGRGLGDISAIEVNDAKELWVKYVQSPTYSSELHLLKAKRSSAAIRQLTLFLDEHEVIRCLGRIQNADVPYETKFPKLLPTKHYFTRLVILAVHNSLLHQGVPDILRREYWIPKGRQIVKNVLGRRGKPTVIISDNAKTFKQCSEFLREIWDGVVSSGDTTKYLSNEGIYWTFNAERAPWWGDFFERMVKIVKSALTKYVGHSMLSFHELETQTSVTNNFISPNPYIGFPKIHLLLDEQIIHESSLHKLKKRMVYQQRVLDHFWERWKTEYLLNLREFHQHLKSPQAQLVPRVGDVVIVKDTVYRGQWRYGVITKLLPGKDMQVRAAQVKSQFSHLVRAITILYPLEVNTNVFDGNNNGDPNTKQLPSHQRPKRNAAIKAREKMTKWLATSSTSAGEDVEM